MVANGLKLKVSIDDTGMNGEGIAHFEGYTLFVPYAVKGGVYRVRVEHTKANVAYCSVVSEIVPSANKIQPPCEVFLNCGGCAVQNMTYAEQLVFKREKVRICFAKQNIDVDILPVMPSDKQYGYRNKLQLPVRSINGRAAFGFFREGTHQIVPVEHCILHGEWARQTVVAVRNYIETVDLPPYDEQANSGMLRHVVARYVDDTLMLTLVINGDELPFPDVLTNLLKKRFDRFCWGYSINKKRTNVIMFPDYHPIYGESSADVSLYGLKCKLSPLSFLQINEYVAGKIYSEVVDNIPNNATVIDVYSGIGLMTALIAKKAARVYGVEVVPAATENADCVMRLNNIDNVTNICGDAAEKIAVVTQQANADRSVTDNSPYIVVLDPPRKGCDRSVLQSILSSGPDHIIYVSCSPATLARDVSILTAGGYIIDYVKPFDMFPQSHHVETLVQLSRSDINS